MHDHLRPEIVDPEIVVLVVAQAAYGIECLLLGSLAAQRASGFQPLVIAEDAGCGLYHVLGLLGLGLVQVAVDLSEHQQAQGQ
ncbi:hypothetical protein D3C77_634980 [compost metagenome]